MSAPGAAPSKHGPYLTPYAGLGGAPTKSLDVPVTSVFLVLFLLGAIAHMTILQVNLKRGKKFIMSGLLFGFCMSRIVTCVMRLVWTTHLTNISVAIAAQIFVSAGVLLLFIVNLIFAQRIIRAAHPHIGWARTFSWAFKLYYASIVVMLIALITCTVQSFYTLSKNTRRIDRDVQLVGSTYFAVAAFLPILLLLFAVIIPKQSRVEKFGEGRFRTKIYIIVITSVLLTLGAAFRSGTAYVPRLRSNPAWYHSKACFYIFNFVVEILVVALFAAIRVDKRFHVPNGSHAPGDYSRKVGAEGEEKSVERRPSFLDRVLSEEEVFDEQPESSDEESHRRRDLEMGNKHIENGVAPLHTQHQSPEQEKLEAVKPTEGTK